MMQSLHSVALWRAALLFAAVPAFAQVPQTKQDRHTIAKTG